MKTYSRKNSSYLKKAFIASNFNEMCRLCLSEVDMVLTPIFQDYKISYRDWIQYSVDVLIEEGDGLPSNICEECLAMVEQTYLFKKKCKASDSKLREHLKLLEIKKGEKLSETAFNEVDEDHNNLFAKEDPNKNKSDESNAVDTGGTDSQSKEEPNPKEIVEEDSQSEKQSPKEVHSTTNQASEENVIINKVKKYILKGGDQDVMLCKVVSLCTKNDELSLEEITDSSSNTNAEHVDQNGYLSVESKNEKSGARVQEIYQLWDNEEEEGKKVSEEVQVCEKNNDNVMIFDVILEDEPEKNLKKLNAKIIQVTLEEDPKVPMQRVYTNRNQMGVVKTEQREELNSCMHCSKEFSSSIELKEHLTKCYRRFSGVVQCKICSKTFTCMNSLKRHMSIHTGIKPFKCKICGRNFNQSSILKRHILTHENPKPFNCDICNRGYTQKMNLLSHLKNHGFRTESESFQCKICSRSFMHRSGLSRHVKLHKGIRFMCVHCKKYFGDPSALSRHVKAVHKIN